MVTAVSPRNEVLGTKPGARWPSSGARWPRSSSPMLFSSSAMTSPDPCLPACSVRALDGHGGLSQERGVTHFVPRAPRHEARGTVAAVVIGDAVFVIGDDEPGPLSAGLLRQHARWSRRSLPGTRCHTPRPTSAGHAVGQTDAELPREGAEVRGVPQAQGMRPTPQHALRVRARPTATEVFLSTAAYFPSTKKSTTAVTTAAPATP
jgi:hypothetical protein